MKLAMVGALVVAGLVVLLVGVSPSGEAQAQRFAEQRTAAQDASQSAELITLSTAGGEQGQPTQQVTIIDPKTRVMGVYHVNTATGEIELKSVRKFDWDLQMEEFNATGPLPREVRSQIAPNNRQR